MNLPTNSITYGKENICFSILFVKRKTMEIAVHPDRNIVIKAPIGTRMEEIKTRVAKRARWILKQMNYFRQFEPRTPQRRYVGGETHLYLGRRYRLKISNNSIDEVKLIRGFFKVKTIGDASKNKVSNLLGKWYAEKASIKFLDCFEQCWASFEKLSLPKPKVTIRKMNKRWGSLSKKGTLTLNTDLILAPKECIEYVINHELCHLQYHDHGPDFYKLLERIMPDWERRKHKLELAMA